ncbi:sensor histidine kinase [Parafrankia discariae]|uniref:sensor histidine kinase n=1 Tax=Parafrankia discariae TaxID=365528 RepID=UPI00037F4AC9|nr:HAMP domain-containing sensor histidine kinase [Parafrankia discariae]
MTLRWTSRRVPRSTLRTQLTLLYAGPFLVSGVLLLAVPILQTRRSVPVGAPPGLGTDFPPGPDTSRVLAVCAVALAVLVVVSIILGWLVAGRFLRPLRTMTATARDISATNLHRRLGPHRRAGEFTELASTLDDLFARLEAAFASQRHFVANASHELRTPLAATRAVLQVALADPGATVDSLRAACRDVLALGGTQESLLEALLTLAGGEQGVEHREPFDLAVIARDVLRTRRTDGVAGTGSVEVTGAFGAAPATGDPRLVESLVANLVDNALRHNIPGGRVEIATATTSRGARVTVGNTGPVVPPDQVERLFEPFQQLGGQRVRRAAGHGLGLAIVRAVAGAHGATLTARARPDGGLDIEILFPGAFPEAGIR